MYGTHEIAKLNRKVITTPEEAEVGELVNEGGE